MSASIQTNNGTTDLIMRPIQWANLPHINDVGAITEADHTILLEIRDVLHRHGAIGRFGVNLLHRHFDVAPDEILVEYTDEVARTQTCRVESLTSFETSGNRIETNWVFDRDGATVVCKGGCVYDRGHARRHI